MTVRTAALAAASATALLAGLPAWAQATPDFGDDSGEWANDGECDDPRFVGEGVAAITVEADRMADATDCRAAWEAGTARLAEAGAAPGAAPGAKPADPAADPAAAPAAPGTKGAPATPLATPVAPAAPAAPAAIEFGDDSGQYPRDGECDDRRFVGEGMATSLGWADVGRDASDCRPLYEAGRIRLWNPMEAQAATQCAAIDFGDDSSEYANDGECDDIRFEGAAAAFALSAENTGKDAADCTRLCAFGAVSLRDY